MNKRAEILDKKPECDIVRPNNSTYWTIVFALTQWKCLLLIHIKHVLFLFATHFVY